MDFHRASVSAIAILCCFLLITPGTSLLFASGDNPYETDEQEGMRGLLDTADTVQLTIDVSRNKKKISKYLYGVHIANWWLYWTNDYSPYCPVTEPYGDPKADDP